MLTNHHEQNWLTTIQKYATINTNTLFVDEVIKTTKFIALHNNELVISTHKNEHIELLNDCKIELEKIYNEINNSAINIVFVLHDNAQEYLKPTPNINSQLLSKYTFDNYIVGAFNQLTCKVMQDVANIGKVPFNPIFIYSKTGMGKTHLVMAAANRYQQNFPDKVVYYISAEHFVKQIISCFDSKNSSNSIEQIKDRYSSYDLLIIDDIQYLADKSKSNEILFTIFNNLTNAGKIIVMTSDRSPSALNGFEDRMISRFSSGITVHISEPDSDSISKILSLSLKENKVVLEDEAIALLATFFNSDIRRLLGVLHHVIYYNSIQEDHNKKMTKEDVQNIIEINNEIIGIKKQSVLATPSKIIEVVSKVYSLKPNDIISNSRTKTIATARHVVMYIMKTYLKMPLKDIGNFVGNRDHSTVLSGIERIKSLMMSDKEFSKLMNSIIKKINNQNN